MQGVEGVTICTRWQALIGCEKPKINQSNVQYQKPMYINGQANDDDINSTEQKLRVIEKY